MKTELTDVVTSLNFDAVESLDRFNPDVSADNPFNLYYYLWAEANAGVRFINELDADPFFTTYGLTEILRRANVTTDGWINDTLLESLDLGLEPLRDSKSYLYRCDNGANLYIIDFDAVTITRCRAEQQLTPTSYRVFFADDDVIRYREYLSDFMIA